ncbi:MAG: hypothetical protein KGJ06_01090 [Pseudomonadota bacterium]|nr:hypothetical protein [Pseudomonadota bacterium]
MPASIGLPGEKNNRSNDYILVYNSAFGLNSITIYPGIDTKVYFGFEGSTTAALEEARDKAVQQLQNAGVRASAAANLGMLGIPVEDLEKALRAFNIGNISTARAITYVRSKLFASPSVAAQHLFN